MLSLVLSSSLGGVPSLSHTSPTYIGPLGGGVLLLHGQHLPFREALVGTVSMLVGDLGCPLIAHRSDPRGAFLACMAPPLPGSNSSSSNSGGESLAKSLSVTLLMRDAKLTCASCLIRYISDLRADATATLSHRRGAEGDGVTLVGLGPWSRLVSSDGLHEQVRATIGGHDALPRFPVSRSVRRSGGGGGGNGDRGGGIGDGRSDGGKHDGADGASTWQLELTIPPITAGVHELKVDLDRLWHEDAELHGTIAIDGAPSVMVTVLPALKAVSKGGDVRALRKGSDGDLREQSAKEAVSELLDGRVCAETDPQLRQHVIFPHHAAETEGAHDGAEHLHARVRHPCCSRPARHILCRQPAESTRWTLRPALTRGPAACAVRV